MRKTGIVLFWALLMTLLLITTASAEQRDIVLFGETETGYSQWVESTCAVDGALYLRTGDIYQWKPGDTEPTLYYETYAEYNRKIEEQLKLNQSSEGTIEDEAKIQEEIPVPPQLYGMINFDGALMTLNVQEGIFYEVRKDELVATQYKADMGAFPGNSGDMGFESYLIQNMIAVDGKIFVIARASDSEWQTGLLYEVNPITGDVTVLTEKKDYIVAITAYKPGKLLVAIDRSFTRNIDEEGYAHIRVWDTATRQYEDEPYTPVKDYNFGGMVYSPENDAIYVAFSTKLYTTQWQGTPEVVNYLDYEYYLGNGGGMVAIGDMIAMPPMRGIKVCTIDPEKLPKQILTVQKDYSGMELLGKFRSENPDVAVNFVDDYYDMDKLTTLITSGEAPDVLTLSSYYNLKSFVEKGYVMDLSDDVELMEMVKQLYPQLQEMVLQGGKLIGYPSSFSSGMWSYDAAMFEKLGIGEFPETMEEFLDLVGRWDDEYADECPDRKLIDSYNENLKDRLFSMVLEQYIALYETEDAPISFNTPEFRAVMEKLEKMPLKYSTPEEREQESSGYTVVYGYNEPLIETYADMGYEGENPKTLVLPPKMSQSSPQIAQGYVWLYVVNPETSKRDLALSYIRFMAKEMMAQQSYPMNPSLNEPVENKYYTTNKEEYAKWYEEEKNRKVDPSEQREHEARLEEMEHYMNVELEKWRWDISPWRIEQYRALAPNIKIGASMLLYNSETGQEMQKIMERYRQGQLSIDQMVRELDQKAQMIFLETR